MTRGWEPLFDDLRAAQAPEALHELVTPWLRDPIVSWIDAHLVHRDGRGDKRYRGTLIQDIQTSCQIPLDWSSHGVISAYYELLSALRESDRKALEVANYLLAATNPSQQIASRLDELLDSAQSVWRVSPATDDLPWRLERRVATEVQERFHRVSSQGRAGAHIQQSWAATYGQDRNPSTAYREAVKAVEAAAQPVITPTDETATLGKMISAFGDKPAKWDVPLGASPDDGRDVLRQMMAGVWHGQHDRHGTSDETRPASVSPEEAEAALHTAISLVHLFTSGLVKRSG